MRYTAAAHALHWLTAALIAAVAVLGCWIAWAPPAGEAAKLRLYAVHEHLGLLILVLTLVRLGHRAARPPPPPEPGQPASLRRAASASHAALYALLLGMPVLGFLATNAWGFPVQLFDLFALPSPLGRHEALAPLLSWAHAAAALALGALVLLHAGAALWHHRVRGDGTLRRML